MTDTIDPGANLSPVKRALIEVREWRARFEELERRRREPIAIIGMGLRLPGNVNDEAGLWSMLAGGVNTATEIPADRWDLEAYYDPDPDQPGKMYTRHGAFLRDVDRFDAEFFGISPREAISLDPQQRLLLEVSWEAFENAGLAPSRVAGTRGGIFLGMGNSDYWRLVYSDELAIDAYSALGNAFSTAAGRLAYYYDLHGPCLTVDTACSGSLVATHLACQSLRAGECDLALVAGVNLILTPEVNINFSKSRMMAPDGRCKTFDAAADGYVRGEGCVAVLLRPLASALRRGERVLATIRGSATNQDGRSGGLTAPNAAAQEEVIRQALSAAGLRGAQIGYLEAHGTGTPLGDPIEVRALAAALGEERPVSAPLVLGSIKTNVGHLEAVAGLAGLAKVVTALRHQAIPPHLHFQRPNPYVEWDALPLTVPTQLIPWTPLEGTRVGGVSSFGFSGSNAHILLEEAPATEAKPPVPDRPLHLLALSARGEPALRQLAEAYRDRLRDDDGLVAGDVCFTANAGRSHFAHRLAITAADTPGLHRELQGFLDAKTSPNVAAGSNADPVPPRVAFLFTGQGAQYAGMARSLYDTSPVFRAALDECDRILQSRLAQPLLTVLFPAAGADSPLDETGFTQPALFALEYALAQLWRSWGVEPAVVLGHSVGEYVAACVAGVFSLEDGLRLIAERGRLMQALPRVGCMAAVFAGPERVSAALGAAGGAISIAAYNGPETVVISGHAQAVKGVVATLQAQGVGATLLKVSHAFHSALLEPMLDEFERFAARIRFSPPKLTVVSNLTGKIAAGDDLTTAAYWRRHAREPVAFAASMATLESLSVPIFLEIGPSPVLLGMGQRCLPGEGHWWLPSLRPGRPDWAQLLESLQHLYVAGGAVDWVGFDEGYQRQRVVLPGYRFQRQRFWIDRPASRRTPEPKGSDSRAWPSTLRAARRQSTQSPIGVDVRGFAHRWQVLERLTLAHAADTLRKLGLFDAPGRVHTVDTLAAAGGIPALYRHLMQRWLERLAGAGLLRREGAGFACGQPLPDPDLAVRWEEARRCLADDQALLRYIENCGQRLTAVISGRESPLETLFPGGSSELAERLYQENHASQYINAVAASALEAIQAALPQGRRLRILEVGAGTGGTTGALLPSLDPERTEYLFTDISEAFMGRAQERFGSWPFVRFGVFDLEKDLSAGGYEPGSFDVVIGANVVHAARDLRSALRRLREILAPGGCLLLVETTVHLAFFDMTTGLIEGWQHFTDDLRGDNPLLGPAAWEAALKAQGFADAATFPERGSPADAIGQHLVLGHVAENPGSAAEPSRSATGPAHAGIRTANQPSADNPAKEDAQERLARLLAALSDEREELMLGFVRLQVMKVLRLDADHPPERRARLMELGLDSLMAVQLRNLLADGLRLSRKLPATLMFDYPSLEALSRHLLKVVLEEQSPSAPEAATPSHSPPLTTTSADALRDLSDAEVEKLLLSRLDAKPPTARDDN